MMRASRLQKKDTFWNCFLVNACFKRILLTDNLSLYLLMILLTDRN